MRYGGKFMKYKSEIQISLIVIRCGRFAAIIYILCKLLSGIVLPYTAYAFQRLVDGIIFSFQNNAEMAVILGPLVMVASIYVFRAIEEPVENYCSFLISQRVGYFYEADNIRKLSKMEYAHFENSSDVDLINRINESAGNAATDLFDNILNLISGTIKIVGTFMLLASYSFLLAVAVVFVAIPIIVLAAKYRKSIHDWYEKNSKKRRKLDYRASVFIDRAASFEMKEYKNIAAYYA